jgi:hypothetical protein
MPATLPRYELMHPTPVREPFHRDGWVYEEKVDGWRMLAYKDGERVRLVSRNGHARAPFKAAGDRAKTPCRVACTPGRNHRRRAERAGPYPFVDQRFTVSVVDLTTFASTAEMITCVLFDGGRLVDTGNVALVAPAGTVMLLPFGN